ncbi:hypothetical protein SH467x_002837 [Pirellulaceae bacterium SH467]
MTSRSQLRGIVYCIGGVVMLVALTGISVRAYKTVFKSHETFSAIWITHDMLVAHMRQTNGKWPADWKDLASDFSSINGSEYGVPNLDWVRGHVSIDFGFDPSSLDVSNTAQPSGLRVIKMTDGSDNEEIRNANERIQSFLLDHRSNTPATRPSM